MVIARMETRPYGIFTRSLAHSQYSVDECIVVTEGDTETEKPRMRRTHPERDL